MDACTHRRGYDGGVGESLSKGQQGPLWIVPADDAFKHRADKECFNTIQFLRYPHPGPPCQSIDDVTCTKSFDPSPMRICSVEPSSMSGRSAMAASCWARRAKSAMVAACWGSGSNRFAATT